MFLPEPGGRDMHPNHAASYKRTSSITVDLSATEAQHLVAGDGTAADPQVFDF